MDEYWCLVPVLHHGINILYIDGHPTISTSSTLQWVGNLWHCILWRSLAHLHFTINPNSEFTYRPSSYSSSSSQYAKSGLIWITQLLNIHQGNKVCCPWIITMNGWSLISLWTPGYHTPTAADSTLWKKWRTIKQVVEVNDGNKGCQHKQLPISLLVSKRDKIVINIFHKKKKGFIIPFFYFLNLSWNKREIPAQRLL